MGFACGGLAAASRQDIPHRAHAVDGASHNHFAAAIVAAFAGFNASWTALASLDTSSKYTWSISLEAIYGARHATLASCRVSGGQRSEPSFSTTEAIIVGMRKHRPQWNT